MKKRISAVLTLTLVMLCSVLGLTACTTPSECTHSGGEATCIAKAVCSICNNEYGETLGHNYGAFTSNGDGTHSKICANDNNHITTEDCNVVNKRCALCNYIEYSKGLSYTLINNDTEYEVISAGLCTDAMLYIPVTYNGKPVTSIGKMLLKIVLLLLAQ